MADVLRMMTKVELFVDDRDGVEVDLESLRFRHCLGHLYELDITIVVRGDLELEDALGHGVRLVLHGPPEWALSTFDGIIFGAQLIAVAESGHARYALSVRPPARVLAERDDQRIFRDLSAPEVIAAVSAGHATVPPVTANLFEPHPAREFTVQYAESDLAFIERIASESGMSLLHDPADAGRTRLIDDTSRLDRSNALSLLVSYQTEGRAFDRTPCIRDVELSSELRPSRALIGDYDWSRPRLMLEAEATVSELHRGEADLVDYGFEVGRSTTEAELALSATRRLEERRFGARVITGRVDYALAVGTFVTVQGHRRASVDGTHLVVESSLVIGRDGRSSSTIRAIAADSSFRQRRLPKPTIAGTQTATVVGAPGETVDVSHDGRVEVEFRWDRRRVGQRGASRRVRVSQAWAGAGYGIQMIPRVGDEVVVAFLDGDPDEPIIVGQVHNGVRPAGLSLPESKTQTVWRSQSIGADGFHQILMEDAGGLERLELRSQRDLVAKALRNESVSVGASASRDVGGNETVTIGGTREASIGEDHQVTVDQLSELRAKNIRMAAQESFETTSDELSLVSATRSDATSGRHTLRSGEVLIETKETTAITAKQVQVIASDVFEAFIGAYMIRADSAGVVLSGPGSTIALSAEGITLSTAGIVDIKGSLVKINS